MISLLSARLAARFNRRRPVERQSTVERPKNPAAQIVLLN
jgi:hypothetical protein